MAALDLNTPQSGLFNSPQPDTAAVNQVPTAQTPTPTAEGIFQNLGNNFYSDTYNQEYGPGGGMQLQQYIDPTTGRVGYQYVNANGQPVGGANSTGSDVNPTQAAATPSSDTDNNGILSPTNNNIAPALLANDPGSGAGVGAPGASGIGVGGSTAGNSAGSTTGQSAGDTASAPASDGVGIGNIGIGSPTANGTGNTVGNSVASGVISGIAGLGGTALGGPVGGIVGGLLGHAVANLLGLGPDTTNAPPGSSTTNATTGLTTTSAPGNGGLSATNSGNLATSPGMSTTSAPVNGVSISGPGDVGVSGNDGGGAVAGGPGAAGAAGVYSKGGEVKPPVPGSPRPPIGPDDQYAELETGEFVIPKHTVEVLGGAQHLKKLIAALHAEKGKK